MEQPNNTVKMILGDKVIDVPVNNQAFNRLTTTGQFVLQTPDGEDLVASCVSFVASQSETEPVRQTMKLTKDWNELPTDSSSLVIFLRNITAPAVGDELDHGIEVVAQGQKVPYLIPIDHWQLFHMQPSLLLSVRSKSNSRLLLMVMPK